jgi:hypothetical protein
MSRIKIPPAQRWVIAGCGFRDQLSIVRALRRELAAPGEESFSHRDWTIVARYVLAVGIYQRPVMYLFGLPLSAVIMTYFLLQGVAKIIRWL